MLEGEYFGKHTAQTSLSVHRHMYCEDDLRIARSHDRCWNAIQIRLLRDGVLHPVLVGYWSNRILKWLPDVRDALTLALTMAGDLAKGGLKSDLVIGACRDM